MTIEDTADVGADGVSYDPATDRYHSYHDWTVDGSISTSVIEAVATVTEKAPTDVEPLYEVVDPDALDSLVTSLRDAGHGTVLFALSGWEVSVKASGEIELQSSE